MLSETLIYFLSCHSHLFSFVHTKISKALSKIVAYPKHLNMGSIFHRYFRSVFCNIKVDPCWWWPAFKTAKETHLRNIIFYSETLFLQRTILPNSCNSWGGKYQFISTSSSAKGNRVEGVCVRICLCVVKRKTWTKVTRKCKSFVKCASFNKVNRLIGWLLGLRPN